MECRARRRRSQAAQALAKGSDSHQQYPGGGEELPDQEEQLIEGELRLRHGVALLRFTRLREERCRVRWAGSGPAANRAAVRAELRPPAAHVADADGEQQRAGDDEPVAHGLIQQRRLHGPGHCRGSPPPSRTRQASITLLLDPPMACLYRQRGWPETSQRGWSTASSRAIVWRWRV